MRKKHNNFRIIKKLSLAAALTMALPASFGWASTEEVDNEGPIMTVPQDIHTYTFSFLPVEDLGNMALVSRKFKEVSEKDALWKNWIEGIHTKEEFVEYITTPVIGYDINNDRNRIHISVYDLFLTVNSGRIFVNDCLYQFTQSPYKTPEKELLGIIHGMEWPYDTTTISLKADESLNLSYENPNMYNNVCFEKIEEGTNIINLVDPIPFTEISSDGAEQGQLCMMSLNCLNENYDNLGFGSYWGNNHAFEALDTLLYGLHNFKNSSDDVKDEAVLFFVQKYVDFRAVNSSPYGDGSYARPYLGRVLKEIRNSFNTDFLTTSYIPPVEYVVENEDLPEDTRAYYSRSELPSPYFVRN